MLIGHTVGITRMILDFVYPSPRCGEEDVRPGVVAGIHFTYFSVLLLGLSWVVCLVGSLLTEAPSRSAVSVGAPAPFRDCIIVNTRASLALLVLQLRGLTVWTTDKIEPPPKELDSLPESNRDPSGNISNL